MPSHRRRSLAAAAALAASLAATRSGAAELAVHADTALPASLRLAFDVRWLGKDRIALAVFETGILEIPVADLGGGQVLVPADRYDETGVWRADRLAVSHDFIAVAAGRFEVKWRGRAGGPLGFGPVFEGIDDIDLDGDRLLLVGVQRGEEGSLAQDAAVAWLGSLGRGLTDLRPVHLSETGPGARKMVACGGWGLGAVRFLAGDGFVVVPGAEPGVFFHDTAGVLKRVWETEPLGIGVRCDFDHEKELLYSADPIARWAYLDRFRFVDDVLPWDGGFALLVKRVEAGGTHWEAVVFEIGDRPPVRFDLPIRSASRLSHLKADRRGDRLVFLVSEDVRPGKPPPDAVPRLLVAEVVRVASGRPSSGPTATSKAP